MPAINGKPANNGNPANKGKSASYGVPVNNRQNQPLNNQNGVYQYKTGVQNQNVNRNVNIGGRPNYNTPNSKTMQTNNFVNNKWKTPNNAANMNRNKPNFNTNG